MAWIVRRNERPLAPTIDECPSVEGLEVVMVRAQPIQEVEDGEVAGGPLHPVVDLQAGGGDAALGAAQVG